MGAKRAIIVGIGALSLVLPGAAVADRPAAAPASFAAAKPQATPAARAEAFNDPFGVRMIHATRSGGRTWFSRWTSARTLAPGQTDPRDPELQNRGTGTFAIAADGTATASGTTNRHYIWDPSSAKKWQNVEVTFYASYRKRPPVAGAPPPPPSGLIIEVRTGDGHVDDPARQCAGASYSIALYDDGRAEFKKEAKHPIYSSRNPSARVWEGSAPMPQDRWIGFKATVRDVPGGVALTLYRDVTDGASGGTWTKVLEYKDDGAWSVGNGSAICGKPANRILTGAHPVVLLRNDNALTRYKKASVREIAD